MDAFESKFRAGLEILLTRAPVWGSLARTLGAPISSTAEKTAWVAYAGEDKKKISFSFNPDYLEKLTEDETAGVILHECSHVFRNDLDDLTDRDNYPNQGALINAQECTINDRIAEDFRLDLPEGVFRGMDKAGQDMAAMTVHMAYKIFDEKNEEQEPEKSNSDPSEEGDPNGGGSPSGGQGSGENPHCGGIQVPEGLEEEFEEAVKELMDQVGKELGMTPEELQEAMEDTSGSKIPAGGFGTGDGGPVEQAISKERMNWVELLAKINPRVLHKGGRPKRKTKNSWTSYNRRLTSVYPRVVLPVHKQVEPVAKKNGDEKKKPVFVIALDLSGSINTGLVSMLQGMISDIPEDLIEAYPCTWAGDLVPFEKDGKVASGGTVISNVSKYVKKIAEETGSDPYVLVITDGQFSKGFSRPGKEWFWMAVDNPSLNVIKNGVGSWGPHENSGNEVFHVRDFMAA